ncbi:MAG: hypothetical protein NZZ41_01480 [Candidatus Dojkabacteria bacterium]|nr:hypothetical protein [Candidatus Dojkabacteria bacterium]
MSTLEVGKQSFERDVGAKNSRVLGNIKMPDDINIELFDELLEEHKITSNDFPIHIAFESKYKSPDEIFSLLRKVYLLLTYTRDKKSENTRSCDNLNSVFKKDSRKWTSFL